VVKAPADTTQSADPAAISPWTTSTSIVRKRFYAWSPIPAGSTSTSASKASAASSSSWPTTGSASCADSSHRIVFRFTPKHPSSLNLVEMWFSIVARKLTRRGNFASVDQLREKLTNFIDDYFSTTLAKPFCWTYSGEPLVA
jgi:hypothetical protein